MKIHLSNPFSRKTFDLFNILNSDYPELKIYFTRSDKIVLNFFTKICYPSANLIFSNDLFKKSEEFILFPQEVSQIQEIIQKNQKFKYCFPDSRTIKICNDKSEFYNFCQTNDINSPTVFYDGQYFEAPKNIIFKPIQGSGSRGIKIEYGFKGILTIPSGYLAQEYIGSSNQIFGFFAFCKQGDIVNSYQHVRIATYPKSGGVSVYSKIVEKKEITKAASMLIKKLNYTGLIMIEYKEFNDNLYAIEINPRLWGSILLSLNQEKSLLDNYLNSIGVDTININKNKKDSIIWIFPYGLLYPSLVKYIRGSYLINYTKSTFFRSLLFTVLLLSFKFFKSENSSI
jgi:predicted ATP-grasp superfamily ATP-dependent carboligase